MYLPFLYFCRIMILIGWLNVIIYLNHPFFFNLTSGRVLTISFSSVLPLIIIKGTMDHKPKKSIQNK